jgi:hypothetical protein
MSYAKAMKHARNVRKCRKQSRMHFGFDVGSGSWPSIRSNPLFAAELEVREWFAARHIGGDAQYNRECIRDAISTLRQIRKGIQP